MALDLGTSSLLGGAISGAGSLFGAGKGASAATDAAKIQADAAKQAAAVTLAMFEKYQTNLQPWMTAGKSALSSLTSLTGTAEGGDPLTAYLTKPLGTQFAASGVPYSTADAAAPGGLAFAPKGIGLSWEPTMAQLETTPGYQFVLDQGTKAVQNAYAAQGLGSSGAALKGATNYAAGLASTTYQNQFANWQSQLGLQYDIFSGAQKQQYGIWQGQNALDLQQRQQIYNMLGAIAGSGQNASVNLGTSGLTAAGQLGNALTGSAAASASGIVGSANAWSSGLSGLGSSLSSGLTNYSLYNTLTGSYGTGTSGSVNPLNYYLGAGSAIGSNPTSYGTGGLY